MTTYRECDFQNCRRKHEARGLCAAHYNQARKGQPLSYIKGQELVQTCNEEGCDRKRYNGTLFCWGHLPQKRPQGAKQCLISGCTYTRRSNGMCEKHYQTAHKYKLTVVQYQLILDTPCEICGSETTSCIDHEHECCPGGKSRKCGMCIRGILCNGCNSAIGKMKEDKNTLMNAIDYLERVKLGL